MHFIICIQTFRYAHAQIFKGKKLKIMNERENIRKQAKQNNATYVQSKPVYCARERWVEKKAEFSGAYHLEIPKILNQIGGNNI